MVGVLAGIAALSSGGGVALGPAVGGEVREGVLLASEGSPSSSSTVTSESVALNSAGTVEPVNKRASSSSMHRVSMTRATRRASVPSSKKYTLVLSPRI